MKASKFLSLFILIGLFSTGLVFGNADALEYSHYYEENIVCGTTTTSTQPVVIEDGVDFDFEDGHKYLIITTSDWGGEENDETYEINMQHGNATVGTIFEGSQQIIEPAHTSNGCNDEKFSKYFHWVVWNPVGVEQAGEDIALNYISIDGGVMTHDLVTIFVLDISETIIENYDWFYDEQTTDEPIDDAGWNTNSTATLDFTPSPNDNDWLILGTANLEIDDIIDQFETRLNYENGTSLKPYLSQEGEDPTGIFVQSFSRVLTLNNTQSHEFTIESRTDELSVGSNIRAYNSIFALNLNIFSSHNATFYEDILTIQEDATPFAQELMTLDIQDDATQDWYIFGGLAKASDKDGYFRLQVDDVDSPADQTIEEREQGHNWDKDDWVMQGIATFENLDNSTHKIDYDGSMKDGAGDSSRDSDSRSIWAFTLDPAPRVFDDITWNDNSTMTFSIFQNATDTVSWSDSVDGTSPVLTNQTIPTDTVTWSDFTNATFSISQEITDTVTWSDLTNATANLFTSTDDTVSWEDEVLMTIDIEQEITDTVTWSDEVLMATMFFSDVLDGTISWEDFIDILFDVSQEVTDTVTWEDDTEMTFDVSLTPPDDTVTWEDEVLMTFDIGQEITDIITWEDDIEMTTMYFSDVLDGTITWNDDVEMEVAFDMDNTDTVTWSDSVTGLVDASGEVTDTITWEMMLQSLQCSSQMFLMEL